MFRSSKWPWGDTGGGGTSPLYTHYDTVANQWKTFPTKENLFKKIQDAFEESHLRLQWSKIKSRCSLSFLFFQ